MNDTLMETMLLWIKEIETSPTLLVYLGFLYFLTGTVEGQFSGNDALCKQNNRNWPKG